MKKRYLLIVIFLSFFFFGCDDINFGVQEVHGTYLILDGVRDSNLTIYYECEKLNFYTSEKSKEEDPDTVFAIIRTYNLNNSDSYRFFYIPHGHQIEDHKNIEVFFRVDVDGILYEASFHIPSLNTPEKTGLGKVDFLLKDNQGNAIPAIFTWEFHQTI